MSGDYDGEEHVDHFVVLHDVRKPPQTPSRPWLQSVEAAM